MAILAQCTHYTTHTWHFTNHTVTAATIATRLYPEGQMSAALAAMKTGDSIRVQGPFELKEYCAVQSCLLAACYTATIATAASTALHA
eukprot:18251-Heterococcus_DN1.PRE.2